MGYHEAGRTIPMPVSGKAWHLVDHCSVGIGCLGGGCLSSTEGLVLLCMSCSSGILNHIVNTTDCTYLRKRPNAGDKMMHDVDSQSFGSKFPAILTFAYRSRTKVL